MGRLKHEFHEVIADEYGAVEDLEADYRMAYAAHTALLQSLPTFLRRTPAQVAQLHASEMAADRAKWKWDKARDWAKSHARERA